MPSRTACRHHNTVPGAELGTGDWLFVSAVVARALALLPLFVLYWIVHAVVGRHAF